MIASVSGDVLRLRRWSDMVAFSDSRPRRAASGAGNVVMVACRAPQPPPASQPLPALTLAPAAASLAAAGSMPRWRLRARLLLLLPRWQRRSHCLRLPRWRLRARLLLLLPRWRRAKQLLPAVASLAAAGGRCAAAAAEGAMDGEAMVVVAPPDGGGDGLGLPEDDGVLKRIRKRLWGS